jgi:hypothetical protein
MDADVVADLNLSQVPALVTLLQDEYYVNEQAIRWTGNTSPIGPVRWAFLNCWNGRSPSQT